ncbi:uncharacterized protein PV09_04289 [Verruconis gallopava]|uniref:TLC domain-containing protein n=1 Tax=Verruconis gallopava TaxID=253628 RepID=A0A0D2ADL3_9PEZI|nr:uncharacterized protein PV09_04289 [Verruconis gallopava]KIW04535.1 hypothetical protein PV09_04289 [Verruconis gallopava]
MAAAQGTLSTLPGDVGAGKKHAEHIEEFLVKESFVPTHHHHEQSRHARKMVVRRRKQSVESSLLSVFCAWVVEHQLGLSINLLLLLSLTHVLFPQIRPRTRKFFEMSYYNKQEDNYLVGTDDFYFAFSWLVIFTGVRVATMEYLLKPFARSNGIKSKKGLVRFAEQGWMFIYYGASWSLGMYIMYNSPYWLNLRQMWTGFPTRTMSGLMKWYYLVQFGFWMQQLFVVNIEERRKDHWQMFTHHIFTSMLLVCSYGFYQTKVGNVILAIMDFCDILLAFAKMLNYLNYQTACDAAFGAFIFSWFITRHIFYNLVCYSIWAHVPSADMPYGCFDSVSGSQVSVDGGNQVWSNIMKSFSEPGGVVCFNNRIRMSFLSLLMALQVLTLIWFGMIIRVAYRVLSGKGAQDSRSDDEGEEEEEEEEVEIEVYDPPTIAANGNAHQKYIVEEADGASVNLARKASESPAAPMRRSSRRIHVTKASGISIPGHGDKKELLGRIGCDKPS